MAPHELELEPLPQTDDQRRPVARHDGDHDELVLVTGARIVRRGPADLGARKYVVSTTLDRLEWNAELVHGDLGIAVQQLKQEPGEGLHVGGLALPLTLAELGLIGGGTVRRTPPRSRRRGNRRDDPGTDHVVLLGGPAVLGPGVEMMMAC